MRHRQLYRSVLLTGALWLGTGLHHHGLCGVTEPNTLHDSLDEHVQECVACPLSLTPEYLPPHTPFELPPVMPSIPIPSLETIMPTSTRVAACPEDAVPHVHHRGSIRQTLVFIAHTAAGLADVPTTSPVTAVCVGCQLAELRDLHERFPEVSLHLASSRLLQELGVTCVPTIVELSPTGTRQEDDQ